MVLLFLLLFFAIYGSEAPIKDITTALPSEIVERILEEVPKNERKDLKLVNTEFYDLISDIENKDSYAHYIARTNLFNKNFDLADSERPAVKNLMQDPVFFLKFAPYENDKFTIPEYLSEKITIEKTEDLHIYIPLDFEGKEIVGKKCLVFAKKLNWGAMSILEQNALQSFLDTIESDYGGKFMRLLIGGYFSIQNVENIEKYTPLFTKYIIQNANNGNTKFHNSDHNLQKIDWINKDILMTKNDEGRTPLFYQPLDTIRLFPDIYINEYDKKGFSALYYQLYNFDEQKQNQKNLDRSTLIKNITALVEKGIRLHNPPGYGEAHVIFFTVARNDLEVLRLLSKARDFQETLHKRFFDERFSFSDEQREEIQEEMQEEGIFSAYDYAMKRGSEEIIAFLKPYQLSLKPRIVNYIRNNFGLWFIMKWGFAGLLGYGMFQATKDRLNPFTTPRLLQAFFISKYEAYKSESVFGIHRGINVSLKAQLWFPYMKKLFFIRNVKYPYYKLMKDIIESTFR